MTRACRLASLLACLTVWAVVSACVLPATAPGPAPAPARAQNAMRTELYFGLSMPDGESVSQGDWRQFLDACLTPRFPDGFSVLDVQGQWKDKEGTIIREHAKLVVLIHPPTVEAQAAVTAVIDAYKTRFAQESVLRVSLPASATF